MPAGDYLSESFKQFNASAGTQLPNSGERVMVPPPGSSYNKMPGPISPQERGQRTAAKNQRARWEASDVGKARTTGFPEEILRQATPAQIHMINKQGHPEPVGPRVYDRQLPGMSDPDVAPRPQKWEEMSEAQQAHAIRGLAKRGTDMETMIRDMGAQMDQAQMRAMTHDAAEGVPGGASTRPYAEDFYGKGAPRKKIDQSADELTIPKTVYAQMNAFTSPNTKFSHTDKHGVTTFPNDDAARHAGMYARQGKDPKKITNDTSETINLPRPKTSKSDSEYGSVQGYTAGLRKAATAVQRHDAGLSPDPKAFEGSPKTGPYANSWNDSHPQYTVADVHSGGGGGFPHLGTEKLVKYDADGKIQRDAKGAPKRDKSGREAAIESTPFAHAAFDYAHRQAMAQRGLGHVRESQAAEWGEEQLQRTESGMKGGPKPDVAYPTRQSIADTTNRNASVGKAARSMLGGKPPPEQLKMF